MNERIVESGSGALRLRVTVELADLFAMTEADRDAFDVVRAALDRLGGPAVVKVDDPTPIIRIDEAPPAAVEDRLVAAAQQASMRRAGTRQGPVACRWGCGESFTTKGVARHEQSCPHDPDYKDRLRVKAAAPVDLAQVPEPAVAEVRHLEPVDDGAALAQLAAAVRATGADPSRLGAASAMFLHDAIAYEGDLADFLRRTPERTIVLVRRELRLEDDDATLPWLRSFLDAYREASAAA